MLLQSFQRYSYSQVPIAIWYIASYKIQVQLLNVVFRHPSIIIAADILLLGHMMAKKKERVMNAFCLSIKVRIIRVLPHGWLLYVKNDITLVIFDEFDSCVQDSMLHYLETKINSHHWFSSNQRRRITLFVILGN
jgi:hypothetical protein